MAHRIVGLDIATSAVRAVELTIHDNGPPSVEAYGQVGLPVGAVVDGEIQDRAIVSAAIHKLWHEGGFVERRAAVGVAGLRAITRELDMPVMPPNELDEAVKFKADEVVPFPLEESCISSKVIAQYTDAEGNPTLRVLVAAAHRDLIDSIVATVNDAGLDPASIDLNTAALVRALRDPGFTGGPEAIVSVGAGLTLVVVHEEGNLQFVRTIDLGGESVTAAIAGALDLPESDAELVKRRMTEGEMTDSRAHSAADEAVDGIVEEIHNSVRFFASLPGRGQVSRVLLTGSGSRSIGLLTKLEEALEIEVTPASATSLIDMSNLPMTREQAVAIAPTLPVPVGLGLPDPSGRSFNLLPKEVAGRQAEQEVRRYSIYAGITVAILLVLLTALRVYQVNHAESQVSSLKKQNAYIANVQIPKYDKVVSEKNQVIGQQKEIKPLILGEVDWLVVLNQLGAYVPPAPTDPTGSASFAGINLSAQVPGAVPGAKKAVTTAPAPTAVIAQATATAEAKGDFSGVSAFEVSLGKSPAITQVNTQGSLAPQPDGTTDFSLNFLIKGTAGTHRLNLVDQAIP